MNRNFIRAKFAGTNFKDADLEKADLAGADLDKANFRGAKNLLQAKWAGAQNIEQAIFDNEKTKQAVLTLKAQQEQEGK